MTLLTESALLLTLAGLLAALASRVSLPPLIGMLLGGVAFSAIDWPVIQGGMGLSDVSSPVRLGILAVVLLRAGLGISVADLRRAGGLGIRLGLLPLLGDVALVCLGGMAFLGLDFTTALTLGFLVGAISPAIVIPGLLDLLDRCSDRSRRPVVALLVGAPLDNIAAILGLGVAIDLATAGDAAWSSSMIAVPVSVGVGLLAGGATGAGIGLWARARDLGGWGSAIALWSAGGGLIVLGDRFDFSFVLGLLALGGAFRIVAPEAAQRASARFQQLWKFLQIALFGLIGAAVDLGPLASVGVAIAIAVLLGQIGRAGGSWLATAKSKLSRNERLACLTSTIPKATIQAAFATLPLDRGLADGHLLLAAGIFAIVLTAPLGAWALHRGTSALLDVREPD